VAVQWEETASRLRTRRVVATGNPVRARLFQTDREAARRRLGLLPDRLTLLALGGSQGALALNEALPGALRLLSSRGRLMQVLHLTGVDHLHRALQARRSPRVHYRAIGFLDRIEEAYAAADLVLARAGGSTLAYVTAAGLPSILVPYPHHADGHQTANAKVLARAGAAILLPQKDMNPRRLADLIGRLLHRPALRQQMARRARALGRPQAAVAVAARVAELAGFAPPARRIEAFPQQTSQPSQAA